MRRSDHFNLPNVDRGKLPAQTDRYPRTALPFWWVVRKLANLSADWRLGISTRGTVPTHKPGGLYYASVAHAETRCVLERLNLQPSDIFVDVGAGKGRVLCLAAQYNIRQVIGVEYSSELAEIARDNVRRSRDKKAPVEVVSQAAEDFDFSSATVLYFFNPFDADILSIVLSKLEIDRREQDVRLAFVMESPAQREVFAEHHWLECYDRWVDRDGHTVALYRAKGQP